MRWFPVLILLVAAFGISGCSTDLSSPTEQDDDVAVEDVKASLETKITGVQFHLYDAQSSEETVQNLLLFLHAGKAQAIGGLEKWHIEDIEGTIYRQDEPDLTFKGTVGEFDKESEFARIEGPLVLKSEELQATLSELIWHNDTRSAECSSTASLVWSGVDINASALLLDTIENRISLTDVSGAINFKALPR